MKTTISVITPLMLGALGLSGCVIAEDRPSEVYPEPKEPVMEVAACLRNCRVDIELPDHVGLKPNANPYVLRVVGGSEVNFLVTGHTAATDEVILSFEKPIFRKEDEPGEWRFTLSLKPGNNKYIVRPFDHWLCHAPDGCKYVIINLADPKRPSRIKSAGVIIDPR